MKQFKDKLCIIKLPYVVEFKCINPQILAYLLVPKVIPFILENIELRLNISFIGI